MFDPLQILVSLLLASAVFMLAFSVFRLPVPKEPPVNRRIAMAMGTGQRSTVFENAALAPVMNAALQIARRLPFTGLRLRIRNGLNAAGNPSGYTVDEYLAICVAASVLLGLLTGAASVLVAGGVAFTAMLLLGALGFFVPVWTLEAEAGKRVSRIAKRLPYSLDLVSLMMGAGSTFTEAIDAIIRDDPDDDLNQELRVVQSEIEFGATRAAALANMAERLNIDAVFSIVGAINQSEMLGSPLSEILTDQAQTIRQHRTVTAEKAAAAASLKILIPSMLILIAVVLVVLGPVIIRGLGGGLGQGAF